jgi:hypothetical protein
LVTCLTRHRLSLDVPQRVRLVFAVFPNARQPQEVRQLSISSPHKIAPHLRRSFWTPQPESRLSTPHSSASLSCARPCSSETRHRHRRRNRRYSPPPSSLSLSSRRSGRSSRQGPGVRRGHGRGARPGVLRRPARRGQ